MTDHLSTSSPPQSSSPRALSPKTTSPSRRHSVRFSPPSPPTTTDPMSRSPPPPNDRGSSNEAPHHAASTTAAAAESSGDEITPIMQRERGGGKGRNYDGTTTTTTTQTQQESDDRSTSSSVKRRRRRKNNKKSALQSTGTGNGEEREEDENEGEGEGDRGGDGDGDGSGALVRWVRGVAEKYGSVELDNKGSVARDHLALERTFLAWLRTSLAFASIGIAVTQLFRLNTTISERSGLTPSDPSQQTFHLKQVGKPLGATFLGIAILVLLLGGRRYFESQYWIVRGKFPASRGSVFLITGVAGVLIVASLVVVCVVDPGVFERR